jgi:hypothetical protein
MGNNKKIRGIYFTHATIILHVRFIISQFAVPLVLRSQVFFSDTSTYQHNEIRILHNALLSLTYFLRVRVNKNKIMMSLCPSALN